MGQDPETMNSVQPGYSLLVVLRIYKVELETRVQILPSLLGGLGCRTPGLGEPTKTRITRYPGSLGLETSHAWVFLQLFSFLGPLRLHYADHSGESGNFVLGVGAMISYTVSVNVSDAWLRFVGPMGVGGADSTRNQFFSLN